jgi:3-phenylpropionate/cinnamic acid dioxygenase small subunit
VSAPLTAEQRLAAHDFLVAEAEALDERRYRDWLLMLTDDVRYRMPVRVTVHAGGDSELAGMDHFDEDRYTLGKRVERLSGEHAWTEDPPSRVRRFVTNVRCAPGPGEGEIAVRSYLLLFRSRGDTRPPEWVAAERRDVLRSVGDALRLRSREITVDESVLRTQNLAVFL